MILTIAIPTYNGEATIERLLISIKKNLMHAKDVEVIVLDNDSSDKTAEICKRYEFVTFFKNDTNIGADANFTRAVHLSSGRYVWLIGDDDYLETHAISRVQKVLETYRPAAVFLNFSLYNSVSNKIVRECWIKRGKENFYKDHNEFFMDMGNAPNFLSSVVHRTQYFQNSNCEEYIGTNWVQYAALLNYVPNKEGIYYIHSPLLINAGNSEDSEGNIGGSSLRIILNMLDILCSLSSDVYTESTRKHLIEDAKSHLLRKIIISRLKGLEVDAEIKARLIPYIKTNYLSFYALYYPLISMPIFFLSLAYSVYKNTYFKTLYWKLR